MKINKRIVSIIVLSMFLITFGGIALANEIMTKDTQLGPVGQSQNLNMRECQAPTCLNVVDQLVKENKLTVEEANLIKEEIAEERDKRFAEREAFRTERDKDRAARQGYGKHYMRMGYCRN
ncbi:MAG TPA: hypothetical protein VFD02_00650 [Syntrophomonadaceae bacterium]|nr:hypothetical protein [Syntrophomonadaceae bacterium]